MIVNELAKRAGVPCHVVRYYTRAGLLQPRRDPKNRYRRYCDADVARLRFISHAKLLGLSLADIGQVFCDADRRRSACPKSRRIILRRLEESERNLSVLLALTNRLHDITEVWRRLPDAVPDGDSIRRLIESASEADEVDSHMESASLRAHE